MSRIIQSILVLLLAAPCLSALHKPQSISGTSAAGEMSFSYKFENPRFDIRVIEIDLNSAGVGELRFTRGTSDEVLDFKVKLLPATIASIQTLFEGSGFLTSDIDFQDKKDRSHMGWVTLGVKQGAIERKTRFNFTTNAQMKVLQDIFRAIATQEISLFDIENAERYQPLDLPKQLETLESYLRLEWIAEPERVLIALNEIAGDDTHPLIARNQAKRIIEAIKKGKFKSPVQSVVRSQ
jgi:hypothetical protein